MTLTASIIQTPMTLGFLQPASDINDLGAVSGDFPGSGATFTYSAGVWQAGAITNVISLPSLGTAFPLAINDSGTVVGYVTDASFSDNPDYAFIWQKGVATELPLLDGQGTSKAYALNNAGTVAGYTISPNDVWQAATWQNAVLSTLAPLTHDYDTYSDTILSIATGINQQGDVVGYGITATSYTHAILWRNGNPTDLGMLPGAFQSIAHAVNDLDQVVINNFYNTADGGGETVPAVWQNGVTTRLSLVSGAGDAFAVAINDSDLVVGWADMGTGPDPAQHAVLWQGSTAIDLNSLLPANSGWVLYQATGINTDNQIVGYGMDHGEMAGFVLTLDGATITLNSAQGVVQAFQQGALSDTVAIADTAGNVSAALDGLEAANAAGKISAITLTDDTTPTLSLSAHQIAADAGALARISGAYAVQIDGSGTDVTLSGIAGHPTTVTLDKPSVDYAVSATDGNTGFLVVDATPGSVTHDEFDQVATLLFSDGAQAYVGPSGITLVRSLGTVPAGALQPLSINAGGEIAGYAGTPQAPTSETGFLSLDGAPIGLAPLSGGQGSEAIHINDQGVVVGESYAATSTTAVYWKAADIEAGSDRPTAIGWLPGDFASIATSVNDQGDTVGTSYTTSTSYQGFLWRNGAMQSLGSLGGGQVDPVAINGSDFITGKASLTSGAFHAFGWRNGVMTDLGVLAGGGASCGEAVSDSGIVVGYSTDAGGAEQAVFWGNGQIHQLPGLTNSLSSLAAGINDQGLIVGTVSDGSGTVAVLWADGAIYNLNGFLPSSSGWILRGALGINDAGQISGTGTYDGIAAAFEITVPTDFSLPASTAVTEGAAGQLLGPVNITDSAADIAAKIDGLASLRTQGELGSVTLTDGGIPNLTISQTQLINDADILNGIAGPHTVTVQMTGSAAQYSFASMGQFAGVSALHFTDETVLIAATPGTSSVTTGNVTELYAAVLAREPDIAGLAFYQNYLKANPGTPLTLFAEWFLSSAEYTADSAHAYAPTSAGDQQFIIDSYQNLLGRTPTAAEIAWYQTNVMAAGGQSHAQMLVYFSASAEFLRDVQITATQLADSHHWLVLT